MKTTTLLSLFVCFYFVAQSQTPDTSLVRVEIDGLVQLCDSLFDEEKYDDALVMMKLAEKKCLDSFGENNPLSALTAHKIGLIHYLQGNYALAEAVWLKAMNIRETVFGKEHLDYAQSLFSLGSLYKDMGETKKAEGFYLQAKSIREKILGKEHQDYASCLNSLGILYLNTGQYQKAELYFLDAKAIREKALGKEHQHYASSLNNLGVLYLETVQLHKAEKYFLEGNVLSEKVLGKEHPNHSAGLSNLRNLYQNMGQYQKAEMLHLEARELRKKVLGTEHPDYAASLHNLGNLYQDIGQYQKAEKLLSESKTIREKVLGKEHPDYAKNLNTLGWIYTVLGDFQKAEKLLLEGKAIREKVFGKENPFYVGSLTNLGALYVEKRDFQKAEIYHNEAAEIYKKVFGADHLYYAGGIHNLASVYWRKKQYLEAESLYLKSKEIRQRVLGEKHPDYAESLYNLGNLYWTMGNNQKAEAMYLENNKVRKSLIVNACRYLSERDLLSYTKTFIGAQNQFFSFFNTQPTNSGYTYDNSLFYKGFLLTSTLQLNRLAKSDSISNELFFELKTFNRRLAKEYSKPVNARDSIGIVDMEEKANQLEKDLARSVAGFGEALQQVNWQDVQSVLNPNEVAIEFVHYKHYNPSSTDSTIYAALIVRPGEEQPLMISLFEEKELSVLLGSNQERRSDYVNDLYAIADRGTKVLDQPKKALYELIWKPLEAHLEGVTNIYFSPSGLLHRINLAAIPTDDEQSLSNQFTLVQVNSTRQLVIPHQNGSTAHNALLMGGIDYDIDTLSITPDDILPLDELATRSAFNFDETDSTLRGGSWNYLKYTEKETSVIDKLLSNNGFNSEVKTGVSATEEFFRENYQAKNSPHILHLATHGFFFPDPKSAQTAVERDEPVFKTSDHPMIRSGLILAGGNHIWQGMSSIQGKEDGILTAYEISQMDLSNTELVVLSACETGLGDIEGNEGVYGLQRAFKIAGAKYLIMSLWQIPDRETKDFMVSFYEHLLEDKMTIPDAFRKTQKEMKERFYNPYQWAGFVLVE